MKEYQDAILDAKYEVEDTWVGPFKADDGRPFYCNEQTQESVWGLGPYLDQDPW